MDRRKLGINLLKTLGVLALCFISWTAGGIYSKIKQLQLDASRIYPRQLTSIYETSMRSELDYLTSNPMLTEEALDMLGQIEREYGMVEEFELDFVEPGFLGTHYFSVLVKRDGVWRDEVWYATNVGPLYSVDRHTDQVADYMRGR